MRGLMARARALLARLAFWRQRAAEEAGDELVDVARRRRADGPPAMAPGEFVVRVPSLRSVRQVHRGTSGAIARDIWSRRLAQGQRPEFWDAPDGTPRRRA